MEQPFLVTAEGLDGVSAVVFSVGYQNPMGVLVRVERDLKKREVRGKVLFDLLLANGTKYNRFYVGEFDGDYFTSEAFDSADTRLASSPATANLSIKNR